MIKLNDKMINEADLVASICRESFYEFVKEFWSTIIPEKPVWNWHIKYLCDEAQYVAERVFAGKEKEYDLIINVPPGSTKSTIFSIMYPAWIWTRMATARVIGGSYASPLAMDLSRKNKDVVVSDKYSQIFSEVELRRDQQAKSYFINSKGGIRYSVGTGGSVTGMHGHFIIIDDPINPEGSVSEAKIKEANRWMNETLPTRKVDKAVTPTILIMQRLHQNDPTANMLKHSGKLKHICLPAEADDNISPPYLLKHYKKGLLDLYRLKPTVLEDYKQKPFYAYTSQFQQKPSPRGGNMFKVDRLNIENGAPPLSRFKRIIRYWDKAGTKDAGAYSAGVKIGLDNKDRVWILNVTRGQWSTDEREDNIKSVARLDGKKVIGYVEQEPGSGGKESAENTLRRLPGYMYKADRPTGDKGARAEPFSIEVNKGNVYLVKAEWNDAFIDEMRAFPDSKYKDQVDAGSGACNKLLNTSKEIGVIF